jgi:5-carboxymethyl-2-hydroxymuconate isomerase
MPHMILEYSANVVDEIDESAVARDLNRELVASGPFRLEDVKARVYRAERFAVAGGGEGLAFAHLTLRILEGRDAETRRAAGEHMLGVLKRTFARSLAEMDCQLTVEVCEMSPANYFKAASR